MLVAWFTGSQLSVDFILQIGWPVPCILRVYGANKKPPWCNPDTCKTWVKRWHYSRSMGVNVYIVLWTRWLRFHRGRWHISQSPLCTVFHHGENGHWVGKNSSTIFTLGSLMGTHSWLSMAMVGEGVCSSLFCHLFGHHSTLSDVFVSFLMGFALANCAFFRFHEGC